MIREYENNPEATAKSFFGEWFRTGDQGILDEDGYLTLTGRLKEMINRGGEKICAARDRRSAAAHPAVAEAVCFGVPHPDWGEEVAAAVVLNADAAAEEAELARVTAANAWPNSSAPKKIHIVQSIPRTATGKIQRLNVAAKAFAGAPA